MFTFRPPAELEAQLEYLSQATGHTKNAIASLALAQYLKTAELSKMPLDEHVIESAYDRHVRETEEQRAQYKHAHEIADGSTPTQFGRRKPDKSHGALSPAIYGRNVAVGLTDSSSRTARRATGKLYLAIGYVFFFFAAGLSSFSFL